MILTYPKVDYRGNLTGGTLSLRLLDIIAIEHMTDSNNQDNKIIEGCVILYVNNTSFDIKADYDEILKLMKDIGEWRDISRV